MSDESSDDDAPLSSILLSASAASNARASTEETAGLRNDSDLAGGQEPAVASENVLCEDPSLEDEKELLSAFHAAALDSGHVATTSSPIEVPVCQVLSERTSEKVDGQSDFDAEEQQSNAFARTLWRQALMEEQPDLVKAIDRIANSPTTSRTKRCVASESPSLSSAPFLDTPTRRSQRQIDNELRAKAEKIRQENLEAERKFLEEQQQRKNTGNGQNDETKSPDTEPETFGATDGATAKEVPTEVTPVGSPHSDGGVAAPDPVAACSDEAAHQLNVQCESTDDVAAPSPDPPQPDEPNQENKAECETEKEKSKTPEPPPQEEQKPAETPQSSSKLGPENSKRPSSTHKKEDYFTRMSRKLLNFLPIHDRLKGKPQLLIKVDQRCSSGDVLEKWTGDRLPAILHAWPNDQADLDRLRDKAKDKRKALDGMKKGTKTKPRQHKKSLSPERQAQKSEPQPPRSEDNEQSENEKKALERTKKGAKTKRRHQKKSLSPEQQPEKSETQPEKSETQPEKSETQPEKSETQPEKSETQPEKSETQPEKSEETQHSEDEKRSPETRVAEIEKPKRKRGPKRTKPTKAIAETAKVKEPPTSQDNDKINDTPEKEPDPPTEVDTENIEPPRGVKSPTPTTEAPETPAEIKTIVVDESPAQGSNIDVGGDDNVIKKSADERKRRRTQMLKDVFATGDDTSNPSSSRASSVSPVPPAPAKRHAKTPPSDSAPKVTAEMGKKHHRKIKERRPSPAHKHKEKDRPAYIVSCCACKKAPLNSDAMGVYCDEQCIEKHVDDVNEVWSGTAPWLRENPTYAALCLVQAAGQASARIDDVMATAKVNSQDKNRDAGAKGHKESAKMRQGVKKVLKDLLMERLRCLDCSTRNANELRRVADSVEEALFRACANVVGKMYKQWIKVFISLVKSNGDLNAEFVRRVSRGDISAPYVTSLTGVEMRALAAKCDAEIQRQSRGNSAASSDEPDANANESGAQTSDDRAATPASGTDGAASFTAATPATTSSVKHAAPVHTKQKHLDSTPSTSAGKKPKRKVFDPFAPAGDTTAQHRSHAYDANCRICNESAPWNSGSPSKETKKRKAAVPNEDTGETPKGPKKAAAPAPFNTNTDEEFQPDSAHLSSGEQNEYDSFDRRDTVLSRKQLAAHIGSGENISPYNVSDHGIQGDVSDYGERPYSVEPVDWWKDENLNLWSGMIGMKSSAFHVSLTLKCTSGGPDVLNVRDEMPERVDISGQIMPSSVQEYLYRIKNQLLAKEMVVLWAEKPGVDRKHGPGIAALIVRNKRPVEGTLSGSVLRLLNFINDLDNNAETIIGEVERFLAEPRKSISKSDEDAVVEALKSRLANSAKRPTTPPDVGFGADEQHAELDAPLGLQQASTSNLDPLIVDLVRSAQLQAEREKAERCTNAAGFIELLRQRWNAESSAAVQGSLPKSMAPQDIVQGEEIMTLDAPAAVHTEGGAVAQESTDGAPVPCTPPRSSPMAFDTSAPASPDEQIPQISALEMFKQYTESRNATTSSNVPDQQSYEMDISLATEENDERADSEPMDMEMEDEDMDQDVTDTDDRAAAPSPPPAPAFVPGDVDLRRSHAAPLPPAPSETACTSGASLAALPPPPPPPNLSAMVARSRQPEYSRATDVDRAPVRQRAHQPYSSQRAVYGDDYKAPVGNEPYGNTEEADEEEPYDPVHEWTGDSEDAPLYPSTKSRARELRAKYRNTATGSPSQGSAASGAITPPPAEPTPPRPPPPREPIVPPADVPVQRRTVKVPPPMVPPPMVPPPMVQPAAAHSETRMDFPPGIRPPMAHLRGSSAWGSRVPPPGAPYGYNPARAPWSPQRQPRPPWGQPQQSGYFGAPPHPRHPLLPAPSGEAFRPQWRGNAGRATPFTPESSPSYPRAPAPRARGQWSPRGRGGRHPQHQPYDTGEGTDADNWHGAKEFDGRHRSSGGPRDGSSDTRRSDRRDSSMDRSRHSEKAEPEERADEKRSESDLDAGLAALGLPCTFGGSMVTRKKR